MNAATTACASAPQGVPVPPATQATAVPWWTVPSLFRVSSALLPEPGPHAASAWAVVVPSSVAAVQLGNPALTVILALLSKYWSTWVVGSGSFVGSGFSRTYIRARSKGMNIISRTVASDARSTAMPLADARVGSVRWTI